MNSVDEHQTIHCVCGDWLKLEYRQLNQDIDGVQMILADAPILICPACKSEFLPDLLRILLKDNAEKGKKMNMKKPVFRGGFPTSSRDGRFELCKDVSFRYDSNDCRYISGLFSQCAIMGFFTPVFFNKRVLHKYMAFDEYRVDMASNTYGTIFHDDWQISFGINRNDKVFVWLGDLDEIPSSEQSYFLSENIESDHDVGSEFYAATREAEFTDFSNENKLLNERSNFDKSCNDLGVKIFRYEKDTYEVLGDLIRPVNWNEQGIIHVINTLNKLCVESINNDSLKQDIKKLNKSIDTTNWGSMKLMQKWIELHCSDIDSKEIMKPFFVLYDFRIVFDHEMKKQDEEEKLDFCYERLGITNKNYESLYDEIVKQMTDSYNKLTIALEK